MATITAGAASAAHLNAPRPPSRSALAGGAGSAGPHNRGATFATFKPRYFDHHLWSTDDGLAFRSIVRDDGDDDDNDDEDCDDDREHGGDIVSRPSMSAIRLPGSTNSSSSPG